MIGLCSRCQEPVGTRNVVLSANVQSINLIDSFAGTPQRACRCPAQFSEAAPAICPDPCETEPLCRAHPHGEIVCATHVVGLQRIQVPVAAISLLAASKRAIWPCVQSS